MKVLIGFLFAILLSATARADYDYMSLGELVCDADYAAVGTIVKVDKNYFYLKVEQYLSKKLDLDTIPIQKFMSWACAHRYDDYKIGQKELVFFRKSNYVISDFDFLGYGGGDEFELPIFGDTIKYQSSYGKLTSFDYKPFIAAIKDYFRLVEHTKETSKTPDPQKQLEFAQKSALHKQLINCRSRAYVKEYEIPEQGMLVNLERNYLYEDYENKIFISTLNTDSIYMEAEDSEVRKEKNYFIVKPKNGWTRRFLNVYHINAVNKSDVLFQQLFEVIELPVPAIYVGHSVKDTILFSGYRDLMPTVAYYLDDMHQDEHLEYKLLSYDYKIVSGNTTDHFSIKSAWGTQEFHERIRKIKNGDEVTISNIFVLYPNGQVRKLKDKTVFIRTS